MHFLFKALFFLVPWFFFLDRRNEVDICKDVVGVWNKHEGVSWNYVYDREIYAHRLDTHANTKYWRKVMHLSKDSCIISVEGSRKIVAFMPINSWNQKTEEQKLNYKDSVRKVLGVSDSVRILCTEGKSFFYDFNNVLPKVPMGVDVFLDNHTDPWYAKAILLIESPNKLQKSPAGANGYFQLMPSVARAYGLIVNKKVDQRADFKKCAYAASCLIKKVCIPQAKSMLDKLGIEYNEQDLWFRLLVMHYYHAGAENVNAALEKSNPTHGDMNLIYKLWQTKAKAFKIASQSYSQVAVAAMIEMDDLVSKRFSTQLGVY